MNEHNDILKALRQQINEGDQPDGPFHVPAGYFTELETKILAKVSDEAAADFTLFTEEAKKQPFTVPDGYFDTLKQNILQKTASPAPVKRLFFYKWQQIAAAAIAGLIILSGIYFWDTPGYHPIAVQNQSNSTPVIRNISVNELTDFVGDASTGNSNGNDKKNSVDINQLFQQVSSQDLESFLNETAANNTELF